jgi:Anti-sigma-K factor rskA
VTHLDEEVMAQWALDGSEPAADAADHLATCPQCQATLAELRELSTELRQTPELSTPPTSVWDQISAELDLSPITTDPGSTGGEPGSAGGEDAEPARRRGYGRGALALAASVAVFLGIGIGLGGAALFAGDEPATTPVAVVQLEPLPGKTGGGTADLIQPGNELQVSVTGLDAQTGFYELWLINSDGQRMVSLGVLDPARPGTFVIPADLTSQGYRIVDVSLEPNDGNPVHSRDSIVRGTIPG